MRRSEHGTTVADDQGNDVRVALTTAPDLETAGRLARALVEEGLAACVNMLPGVRSIYRWEGEVHDDAEVLLVVKTSAARGDALVERLASLHPYDVPELLLLSVVGGSEAYIDWVRGQVAS